MSQAANIDLGIQPSLMHNILCLLFTKLSKIRLKTPCFLEFPGGIFCWWAFHIPQMFIVYCTAQFQILRAPMNTVQIGRGAGERGRYGDSDRRRRQCKSVWSQQTFLPKLHYPIELRALLEPAHTILDQGCHIFSIINCNRYTCRWYGLSWGLEDLRKTGRPGVLLARKQIETKS